MIKQEIKGRKMKQHQLTDGTFMTCTELANLLGCSLTTARNRLSRSKDREVLLREQKEWMLRENGQKYKAYYLDDGTSITVPELMEKLGFSRQQASYRLIRYTDPAKVFQKVKSKSDIENDAMSKSYAKKPINDVMHRLFMMM